MYSSCVRPLLLLEKLTNPLDSGIMGGELGFVLVNFVFERRMLCRTPAKEISTKAARKKSHEAENVHQIVHSHIQLLRNRQMAITQPAIAANCQIAAMSLKFIAPHSISGFRRAADMCTALCGIQAG